MRFVCDTNIYLAALRRGGFCNTVLELILSTDNTHELWVSEFIIQETKKKAAVFALKKLASQYDIDRILQTIESSAHISFPSRERITNVSRDPDDNRILECAVSAQADVIVTMDKDLLVLKQFRGIAIVHPKTFIYMQPKD